MTNWKPSRDATPPPIRRWSQHTCTVPSLCDGHITEEYAPLRHEDRDLHLYCNHNSRYPQRGSQADRLHPHMLVAVPRAAVAVLAAVDGGGHQVEMAVAHAALADRVVGELLDRARGAAQHRHLQAAVVVEMDVHGRDLQVVVPMLCLGQPLAELPGLVIVDVGEGGDAMAVTGFLPALPRLRVAQDVAQCLRTAAVAAPAHVLVERLDQIVVDRKGDALHVCCSQGSQSAAASASSRRL